MRAGTGLVVFAVASVAAAQPHFEARATAGFTGVAEPAAFGAEGALRIDASHNLSGITVFAAFAGVLAPASSFTGSSVTYTDLGSVVGAQWRLRDLPLQIRFDLFPVDGIRVREAFDFANVWGRPVTRNFGGVTGNAFAPLARVMLLHPVFDLWAAISGYTLPSAMGTGKSELAWSARGGLAVRFPAGVTLELRGGAHDRGLLPSFTGVPSDERVLAGGGTGRLSWSYGGGVSPQVDLFTYANDPERFERFFTPDPYDTNVAAWVGVEGGVASQNLPLQMGMPGAVRTVTGYADAQVRLRVGHARVFVTGRYQPTEFIQFDGPGLPAFTLVQGTSTLAGWLGADYRLDEANLEVGIQLRLRDPAQFSLCPATLGQPQPPCGANFTLLGFNQVQPLADPDDRKLVPGGMVTIRYAPVRPLLLLVAALYERDANGRTQTMNGMSREVRETITFKLYAQAQF